MLVRADDDVWKDYGKGPLATCKQLGFELPSYRGIDLGAFDKGKIDLRGGSTFS